MSNHISEEGPRQGHAAGDTSVEQQASQLASDIKYKARQKMKQTSGSALSPAQVQALYRQLLNASPAPGAVKSIVKQKLFKEQVDCGAEIVSETVKGSKSNVFGKIFVEGGGQKVEDVIEEDVDQKFIVRVTDKSTGNTSYRKADRAKISELRANTNISSVEITGRKKADDAYDSEKSGGKKAKKDYDGDGKIESGTAEYMGSRDKAIKKAMAKEEVEQIDEVIGAVAKVAALGARGAAKAATLAAKGAVKAAPVVAKAAKGAVKGAVKGAKVVNKVGKKVGRAVDTADKATNVALKVKELEKKENAKEEVIYEKEENGDKKIDVMKGKNTVKVNPSLGESIRAELDALKAVKIEEQEAVMKQQEDEKKKEALANQQAKKDKMMKLRILQNKMRAVRGGAEIAASHELEGDTIAEGEGCAHTQEGQECPVHGKSACPSESKKEKEGDEDPRSMGTKVRLARNKLRSMGLKMSYDMEGEVVNEEDYDRMKDRRMERGGVGGNIDYSKPPAAPNLAGKKKPKSGGPSALDFVKAEIRKKHGDKAIIDTKKK